MPQKSTIVIGSYESDDGIEYLIRGAKRSFNAVALNNFSLQFCPPLPPSNQFATPPVRLPSNISPRYVTIGYLQPITERVFRQRLIVGNLDVWNALHTATLSGEFGAFGVWQPDEGSSDFDFFGVFSYTGESRNLDIVL